MLPLPFASNLSNCPNGIPNYALIKYVKLAENLTCINLTAFFTNIFLMSRRSLCFAIPVTESSFAAGGYRTPAVNSTLFPVTPFELVTKNYHAAAAATAAYNQVSSFFVC